MAMNAKTDKEKQGGSYLYVLNVYKLMREILEVEMGLVAILTALIGIWAIACLIGGIFNEGFVEIVKEYILALTGRSA